MKTFTLLLALSFSALSWAEAKVSAIGLEKTALDFVWKLRLKEAGNTGQLDCQSFFHTIMLSDGKKDVLQYLDAQECDQWRDKLESASPLLPVCLTTKPDQSITPVDCNAKPI